MENFDTTPYEGTNINLTSVITSDLALTHGSPYWEVIGGDLPPSARSFKYISDEMIYSKLSLYNLSPSDTGSYTNIASNECGTSSLDVYIQVKEGIAIAIYLYDYLYIFFSTICV